MDLLAFIGALILSYAVFLALAYKLARIIFPVEEIPEADTKKIRTPHTHRVITRRRTTNKKIPV